MIAQLSPDQDQIYQTLTDEILRFEHKPGDLLSEHYLCQRFAISRTPVRSVLQRLQENGLVQILPRRGSIVTRLDYDIVNQFIYERVAVESMVLRDFILSCTPADVERVRFAFRQLEELSRAFFDDPGHFQVDQFRSTDLAMHEIWFKATKKGFLWKHLSGMQASYTRFCTLDVLEGGNPPDVIRDHQEMLDLIDSRCVDKIEPLMHRHLYGGVRRLGGLVFTKYADYFEPTDN